MFSVKICSFVLMAVSLAILCNSADILDNSDRKSENTEPPRFQSEAEYQDYLFKNVKMGHTETQISDSVWNPCKDGFVKINNECSIIMD